MGNRIARTTQAPALECYLHELPSSYNLVLKEVLGRGRFFKSILCKHVEGLVLVKVYFKRGDYIDLREYERRSFEIKEVFKNVHHSHVWPLQFSVATPVEKVCLFIPHALGPTSSPLRPLVYVAAGHNELSLWNAENGSCYQVLKAADTSDSAEINDIPCALARSSAKSISKQAPKSNINQKYRVDELNVPLSCLAGIRSLLTLPGGDLLSGGTDMRIRRWDHSSPDKSYCVWSIEKGVGKDEVYETKNSFGIQVVQEIPRGPGGNKLSMKAIHTAAATDSAGCHRDAILSISSAKLNRRLLISSSRDGTIKVWK